MSIHFKMKNKSHEVKTSKGPDNTKQSIRINFPKQSKQNMFLHVCTTFQRTEVNNQLIQVHFRTVETIAVLQKTYLASK